MNWLDITITILTIIFVGLIVWWITYAIVEDELEHLILAIPVLIIVLLIPLRIFVTLDKSSGSTIGIVTSVDKNFFGTTAIYIKTTETNEEKYCIEDLKIVEEAKSLIGSKVKISYGTRVGWYSTSKCHQAPLTEIEELKGSDNK